MILEQALHYYSRAPMAVPHGPRLRQRALQRMVISMQQAAPVADQALFVLLQDMIILEQPLHYWSLAPMAVPHGQRLRQQALQHMVISITKAAPVRDQALFV